MSFEVPLSWQPSNLTIVAAVLTLINCTTSCKALAVTTGRPVRWFGVKLQSWLRLKSTSFKGSTEVRVGARPLRRPTTDKVLTKRTTLSSLRSRSAKVSTPDERELLKLSRMPLAKSVLPHAFCTE